MEQHVLPFDTSKHTKNKITYKLGGPQGECWESTRHENKGKYSTIRTVDGSPQSLHRLVCTIAHGEIPKGMVVMHSCDNPSCFNPEHLSIGTYKDNTQDAVSKGRMRTGKRKPPVPKTKTETLIPDSMLKAIEQYQEENYIKDRTAAILELIRKGLQK